MRASHSEDHFLLAGFFKRSYNSSLVTNCAEVGGGAVACAAGT